ncbi:class I SAM-dependent methyltransferase [Vineibacter terrae]|uniref:class I SAM-dependent methyltransferase n=1 Tax=Vineibacter terrae TaxID=2586908 RepID=UPI002E32A18A|nr:class I SAM-dependent methyltransferase [Vineibacter terrae]HEX2889075.1 class I SAM-dependent methyltransferase [Vineibacter terrae]
MAEDEPQGKPADQAHWTRVADDWIAWARSPDHDAFWAYRTALADFIGGGDGEVLDVGCGEGRVSRLLGTLGYRVTAADAVTAMVAAAAANGSAHRYAVADIAALPFGDQRFDKVVAYNVLMDVADVPGGLREISRVMRPQAELVVSLVHPFRDRGSFAGPAPDAPFVMQGSYFGRERFEGREERDGLVMHFAGWSQPLEAYAAALEGAGLAITAIREPIPAAGDGAARWQQWTRLPMFLWLKARPLVSPP